MIFTGMYIAEYTDISKISKKACFVYILLSFILSFAECRFLASNIGNSISCDMTFFNSLPAVFLFIGSFKWSTTGKFPVGRSLRKMADVIYVIHIMILECINMILGLEYQVRFFAVAVSSVLFSLLLYRLRRKFK